MSIHVQLERFEGPLGLLLHLIREQEMDIFNINIHHITRQYLDYIRTMRRLDLEVAGEFVAMAATLLHIKSRMLLPQYNEEGEEVTPEDPRKELVQKLIEYKKFKELSAELAKRPWLGRDVFTRGEREVIAPEVAEAELVLEENPLFSLISAYRAALKGMKKSVHKVASELQSIASRILEMRHLLVVGRRVVFADFITASENTSNQVLVTFLSLLELAKMGLVSVFQAEPFAEIHVETRAEVDRNAVSNVENYDSVNSDLRANEIIHDAELSLDEPAIQLEGEEDVVIEAGAADAASDDDIAAEEARLFGGGGGGHGAVADADGSAAGEPANFGEQSVGHDDAAAASGVADVIGTTEPNASDAGDLGQQGVEPEAPLATAELNAEVWYVQNDSAAEVAQHAPEPGAAPSAEALYVQNESAADIAHYASESPAAAPGIEALYAQSDSGEAQDAVKTSEPEVPLHAAAPSAGALYVQNDSVAGVAAEDAIALSEPEPEPESDRRTEAVATPTPVLADAIPADKEKLSSALSAAFSAFSAFEDIPTPKRPSEPEVES